MDVRENAFSHISHQLTKIKWNDYERRVLNSSSDPELNKRAIDALVDLYTNSISPQWLPLNLYHSLVVSQMIEPTDIISIFGFRGCVLSKFGRKYIRYALSNIEHSNKSKVFNNFNPSTLAILGIFLLVELTMVSALLCALGFHLLIFITIFLHIILYGSIWLICRVYGTTLKDRVALTDLSTEDLIKKGKFSKKSFIHFLLDQNVNKVFGNDQYNEIIDTLNQEFF